MNNSDNTSSDKPPETTEASGKATRIEQALTILFIALLSALVLLLFERVLRGGWRSLWSFVSTMLLIWLGLLPAVFVNSAKDAEGSRILGLGAACGAALGLLYGIVFRSLIPGVFFGACIGNFVGLVLHKSGFHVRSVKSASGLVTGEIGRAHV